MNHNITKNKKAWIIYGRDDAIKNQAYIELYYQEGRKRNIEFQLLLVENIELGCDQQGCYVKNQGARLEKPVFAVVRTIYPLLSSHLEEMGIKTYNNSMVSRICNDKARTCQYLSSRGIPCIPTTFYQHDKLIAHLPIEEERVIKTVDGHGGSQVFLYNQTDEIRNQSGSSDFVLQPRIRGTGQDIRVYVIGHEIIAAVCRQTTEGFRANFSLGGNVSLYSLSQSEQELVERVISFFDFGMVGIDFLVEDDGHWILNEIEDVVGARMLYQCSDINLVGRYIDYMISNK